MNKLLAQAFFRHKAGDNISIQSKIQSFILDVEESLSKIQDLDVECEKEKFLCLAQRAADREAGNKLFLIERHKEKLLLILKDLKDHQRSFSNQTLTEISSHLAKDKLDKTVDLLREEQHKKPNVFFDLQIGKTTQKENNDRTKDSHVQELQEEIDRLRQEHTKITTHFNSQIDDVVSALNMYTVGQFDLQALVNLNNGEKLSMTLGTFIKMWEEKIHHKDQMIAKYKENIDKQEEQIDHLKIVNEQLEQHIFNLKESLDEIDVKYGELENQSNAKNTLNHELTQKVKSLEEQVEHFENMHKSHLNKYRKEYAQQIENTKLFYEKQIESNEVKFNQRFDELKEKHNNHQKQIPTDAEYTKLKELHEREISVIQKEYEDFAFKIKNFLGKIIYVMEKAVYTSSKSLLRGILSDLVSLEKFIHNKYATGSILWQEPVLENHCRRCNNASASSCTFHPYHAKVGTGEFLYSKEWHLCRKEGHSEDTPGCYSMAQHYYGEPSATTQLDIYLSKYSS